MVGIIPILAAAVIEENDLEHALTVGKQFADLLGREGLSDPAKLREAGVLRGEPGDQRLLLSLAGPDRLERLFGWLFDEGEFLSPHGLRALSAWHRDHPYELDVEGIRASVDYEPAESTTSMFGGNSNWRGPVWFPLNYLVDQRAGALPPVLRRRVHHRVPDRVGPSSSPWTRSPPTCPTGSSRSSPAARTAAGPASAGPSGCRTIRPGRTT